MHPFHGMEAEFFAFMSFYIRGKNIITIKDYISTPIMTPTSVYPYRLGK